MKFPVTVDWNEFIVDNMCSLCGNWGVIDNSDQITPALYLCGKLNFCICPNGRAWKEKNADIEFLVYEMHEKLNDLVGE
jgi:hypothetical protein